jgi:hypothetical protein
MIYYIEEEGPSFPAPFSEKIKDPSHLRGISSVCLQCGKKHGMIICDAFDDQTVRTWLQRWTDTLCFECSEKVKDKMTFDFSGRNREKRND